MFCEKCGRKIKKSRLRCDNCDIEIRLEGKGAFETGTSGADLSVSDGNSGVQDIYIRSANKKKWIITAVVLLCVAIGVLRVILFGGNKTKKNTQPSESDAELINRNDTAENGEVVEEPEIVGELESGREPEVKKPEPEPEPEEEAETVTEEVTNIEIVSENESISSSPEKTSDESGTSDGENPATTDENTNVKAESETPEGTESESGSESEEQENPSDESGSETENKAETPTALEKNGETATEPEI